MRKKDAATRTGKDAGNRALSVSFPTRGFTLLEVLIGVAILAILGLLIAQVITATTRATRMSNIGIDAAAQARLAFDRLGLDLAALVKRRDVDFVATNSLAAGPPYPLMFLSEVTSPGIAATNNRGVSLVGYQIAATADSPTPGLLRGAVPLAWSGSNSQGITGLQTNGLPITLASLPITLSAQDFDVLAPAVIRTVIGFQLYPSGENLDLANGTTVTARGQVVYSPPVLYDNDGNPSSQIDRNRISSLIIGLVAMDPETLTNQKLDADQVTTLADCFPTPSDGELPVGKWTSICENASALPSSIPLPARQSLRVFQRAFPITPYGVSP
jgi:prepilin-type N-terminal cleavage/methylation domain-containing protein